MSQRDQLLQIPKYVFSGLPAYLGGKRRLLPLVFAALTIAYPRQIWPTLTFLDPMSGGGSVALAAKWYGFQVKAGDIAERSLIVVKALIANHSQKLLPADVARLILRSRPIPVDGQQSIETRFAGLLVSADTFTEPLRSLMMLAIVNSYLQMFPMSRPSSTDARHAETGNWDLVSSKRLGHYLKALNRPLETSLLNAAHAINQSVIGGSGEIVTGHALQTIASSAAEIVYLDPPYSQTIGYVDNYRRLDQMLEDTQASNDIPTLDELFEASSRTPTVVLSYGGPRVALDVVINQIERHRPVTNALEVPYRHLKSISKKGSHEYVILCSRN
jgi:hypothetical protein